MERITEILPRYDLRVRRGELEIELHDSGDWVQCADLEPILKELHELRKDKARKQYLIDSVQFVIPFNENKHALCEADFFEIIIDSQSETADKEFFDFHESADDAIDAAIAKSEECSEAFCMSEVMMELYQLHQETLN
jgi:hypothetical protein